MTKLLPNDIYLTWSRDFSFLNTYMIALSHHKYLENILGAKYHFCAFTYSRGEINFYRSYADEKQFNEYVGKKAMHDINYRKLLCEKLFSLTNSFNDYLNHNPVLNNKNINDFLKLHKEITPYHIGVYWAADYIAGLPIKNPEINQALEELVHARKYNEYLYPEMENWLKKQGDYQWLTEQELLTYFGNKKIVPNDILNERREFSFMFCTPDKCKLFTGDKARRAFEKNIKNLSPAKTNKKIYKIHGVGINKGKVLGKVRLIKKLDSIPKVETDEIIVTQMTRPQFNYLFSKALAIITDEGALLSHAAILAREYNIPAIIGTKIATQVLKDGDLVEVDGEKGIIRILK